MRIPDPDRYGNFITVDKIRGQRGLPTISVESHLTRDLSDFLSIVRKGCEFDIQIHAGVCEDPRDFNGGWEKIYILEAGLPTSYDTGEFGALDADQEAVVNETIPLTGEDYYEVKRLLASELGASQIVQEIMGVVICDSASCGACGISSDGCQKIFAVTKSHGGSPGLPAEVIYTPDAGATIGETNITTMLASEDPSGLACVGTYLVVISSDGLAAHYASLAAILAGTASWTKVTTGLVASKTPNAIFSLGSTFNWVVANGGYIYFTADITAGFSVLTAGSVSVNNLVAIHGVDENNLVAVGASNTVLVTHDGGTTWASVTGPAVGVQLNTIWMKTDLIWLVGTAGGKLFYTRDGGATWTEKAFSGSGAGAVSDIKFSTNSVGYMAHKTAAPVGRIFRTLDGGNSWYVLPEQSGQTVPDNDGFNSLAACGEDPNVVYGGGLGANALDGILVKLA